MPCPTRTSVPGRRIFDYRTGAALRFEGQCAQAVAGSSEAVLMRWRAFVADQTGEHGEPAHEIGIFF